VVVVWIVVAVVLVVEVVVILLLQCFLCRRRAFPWAWNVEQISQILKLLRPERAEQILFTLIRGRRINSRAHTGLAGPTSREINALRE
jgi:hypothetical protein